MDFRSFKLNFEVNAFLYDKDTADDLEDAFLEDIRASKMMNPKDFEEQSLWLRIKQTLSRLLSPIL
jgi:cardiolipin synthase